MDDDLFSCPICTECVSKNIVVKLSQCGCSFCNVCLVLYVTSVLNDRWGTEFPCPSHQCTYAGQLTDEEIKELLSPLLYKKYVTEKRQREVRTNAALTFCPALDCGAICELPPVQQVNEDETVPNHSNYVFRLLWSWCRRSAGHPLGENGKNTTTTTTTPPTASPARSSERSHSRPMIYVMPRVFHRRHTRPRHQSSAAHAPSTDKPNGGDASSYSTTIHLRPSSCVTCPTCDHKFCARCHLVWHPNDPSLCQPPPSPPPLPNHHWRLCSCTGRDKRRRRRRRRASPVTTSPLAQNEMTREGRRNSSSGGISHVIQSTDAPPPPQKLASTNSPRDRQRRHRLIRWRPRLGRRLKARDSTSSTTPDDGGSPALSAVLAVGFPPYPPDAWLKRCPACWVPIERVEGCAQMMCRSCKHTFCWYCLASLDVVGVFAGLTVLFLVAAPFVLMAFPCLLCAKCHRLRHQSRLRKRHSQGMFLHQDSTTVVAAWSQRSERASELQTADPVHVDETNVSVETSFPQTVDIHWSGTSSSNQNHAQDPQFHMIDSGLSEHNSTCDMSIVPSCSVTDS